MPYTMGKWGLKQFNLTEKDYSRWQLGPCSKESKLVSYFQKWKKLKAVSSILLTSITGPLDK